MIIIETLRMYCLPGPVPSTLSLNTMDANNPSMRGGLFGASFDRNVQVEGAQPVDGSLRTRAQESDSRPHNGPGKPHECRHTALLIPKGSGSPNLGDSGYPRPSRGPSLRDRTHEADLGPTQP